MHGQSNTKPKSEHAYRRSLCLWRTHLIGSQALRDICQSTEFASEFPNPIDEEKLVGLIEYYVKYVEDMIHRFGEIFKGDQ
jgi:hypothetical protein